MDLDNERLVSVFSTGRKEIFLIAKSLLDDAEINYSTKNAGMRGTLFSTTDGGMQILVLQKDEEEAKQILKDLETDDDNGSDEDEEVSEEDAIGQVQEAVKYDSGSHVKLILVILAIVIILTVIYFVN